MNESQVRLSNVERSKLSDHIPYRENNQVLVDTTNEYNSQPRNQIYNTVHTHDDSQLKSLNGVIHKLDES